MKATLIASLCAFFLAIIKLVVALLSSSLAMLSSAIDSLLDSFISALNTLALRKVNEKANEDYNFGYEKLEGIISLIQGLIIIAVGLFILYQSIEKIYTKEELNFLMPTIITMLFCTIVTFLLIMYLKKANKDKNSLILQADTLHYKIDLLTNSSILFALIIIYFTNFYIIDAIFGILISLYTMKEAFTISKNGFYMLLDKALDKELIDKISKLILETEEIKNFHLLKSRSTANTNYLSVHLVFSPTISLIKAHDISHNLEEKIKQKFNKNKWDIVMHLDPYDDSLKDLDENSTHST